MSQWLSLSRAAHLIGVSRAVLQQRIAAGELPAAEGMVTTDDLQRLYPDLRLEDSGAFERITKIREEAFGKRIRERVLPSQEVLAQRLATQSEELADVRRHLAQYHGLVEALRMRIGQLAVAGMGRPLDELVDFVEAELAQVLASEAPAPTLEVMDAMLRVMTAHVTVKPSGHEFFVEGNETVLEAALRAGLAPAYGCGNGNCGLCKARVVSGQLKAVRNSDYPLSPGERAQGYALLCAHTAVSDLVLEMLEARAPEDIPEQEILARVKRIAALNDDIRLLHLQTPRSQRLRFLAGQRATLAVSGAGESHQGEYPIASCPCDDRNLVFHIRRDSADAFAGLLFAGGLQENDTVSLSGPRGSFVLRKDSPNDMIFLACDSGFAPVKSLVEHAVSADAPGMLRLVWVATAIDGHYLANQCRAWADAIETFSYRLRNAADPQQAGELAAKQVLDEGDWSLRDCYVVGPPEFVAAARQRLQAAGLPAEQLSCEVLPTCD